MDARSSAAPAAAPKLSAHPLLDALIETARQQAADHPPALGLVYPCDTLAMEAAYYIAQAGFARPVLVGPKPLIQEAADEALVDWRVFEIIDVNGTAPQVAQHAATLARDKALTVLMKGSLHTDELMSAVVSRESGLRGPRRISHTFVFDLPRYHKLMALTDCVVNIAPDLATKRDIVGNAVQLLQKALHIAQPKIGIVAAVETVNPQIPATLDAQALVEMGREGAWPGVLIEGPFGFDNAFSAEAARIKKIESAVAGDADLLVLPDVNAGNMLYKSFVYAAGGECAGVVMGARVPVVLTSRSDSTHARLASAALGSLAIQAIE